MGIVVLNERGTVTYQNKTAAHITENGNPLTKRQIDCLLEKQQRLTSVQWQPDNHSYSIDGIPLSEGAALVIRDVSEQCEARKALEEREEKFRLLTEHAPTGVAILREGTCTYANGTFGSIVGDDVAGIRFLDLVHPGDQKTARNLLNKARTGTPPSCIIRLQSSTGDVWAECTATAIRYEGQPAVLINVMDITRHKQLEDEYLRSRRRMERAMERERHFIEDVSHHFFNPLCIAKGFLNLSMRDADSEVQRKLKITRDAVARMETVVKNVVRDGHICE